MTYEKPLIPKKQLPNLIENRRPYIHASYRSKELLKLFKAWRIALGLKVTDVASAMNMSYHSYKFVDRANRVPSYGLLIRMLDFYIAETNKRRPHTLMTLDQLYEYMMSKIISEIVEGRDVNG